jgi:hypothetical protein
VARGAFSSTAAAATRRLKKKCECMHLMFQSLHTVT